jgi:transmembrane sensor
VIDDAVRRMAEREPDWDPLRERRVLARIEAQIQARFDGRAASRSRRWIPAAIAVAAAAIIAAVALWPQDEPTAMRLDLTALVEPPEAPAASWPAIPSLPPAAIALADGSTATLHDGARIELAEHTGEEIVIEQSVGRVHYEVRPGMPRTFTVVADDVQVVVLGTAFWVTREETSVRVTVEHGRVRVLRAADGETPASVAELGAGDELSIGVDEPPVTALAVPTKPREATVRPKKPVEHRRSIDDLLEVVDDARGRNDLAAAATALREIVEQHRDDPRAYGSAFQLGKIERSRGRHAAAARAFAGAARRSPAGALSEDARAEAAISWFDAGSHDAARKAGDDYLARHPGGTHEARVQRMLQRLP